VKVTDVTTYQLSVKVDQPFISARGWSYNRKNALLVKLDTDAGITGWGECYGPAAVAKSVVETLLKPQVIGRDPFDVEVIWERLYAQLKDYGLNGMSIAGISGVDIALWDVIGKACGQPIHKLIGGCFRNRVAAYATGFFFKDLRTVLPDAVAEARRHQAQGFRAMKMKIGLGSLRKDLERIQAVRDTVGPETQLMVDANHCFTVSQAILLGRRLEELDIAWFEEPISPEDLDGYVAVTQALDLPIAGGENQFTRFGFQPILARRAMDIVEPDLCAAGGITECKKIAALASAHCVPCVPHSYGSTAIGLAATLQFLAALPDCPSCLIPVAPMLELEQTFNPFRDELSREPLTIRDGCADIPQGPGLGIEVNPDTIERYLLRE
jgi:D-galactarolactone cycloisomerase